MHKAKYSLILETKSLAQISSNNYARHSSNHHLLFRIGVPLIIDFRFVSNLAAALDF